MSVNPDVRDHALLEVRSLHASYVDAQGRVVRAVQGVDFTVPEGRLFTLLGPSGCGKTTTMRCIAGLERPLAGEVRIASEVMSCAGSGVFVAPSRRSIGMVFQSYAIWPHLSVFENAAFPLRVAHRRRRESEIKTKVTEVLGIVGLEDLAGRDATALSGGQQQRLALARALAMEPRLLLLDEPLSNLDAKLRERMRFELQRLQRTLGLTTVYVTHDQAEALALSHEIAVMREGRIEQVGSPREIYERPANRFVADFIGSTNLVDAVVQGPGLDAQCHQAQSSIGLLEVRSGLPLHAGDRILVSIRPEGVQIVGPQAPGPNRLSGAVTQKVFLGDCVDLQLQVGSRSLQVRTHPSVATEVGDVVQLQVKAQQCIPISSER